MPTPKTKARMGRPPLPEEERGKRTNLYLSAAAIAALEELKGEENASAYVSRMLLEALERARRRRRSG